MFICRRRVDQARLVEAYSGHRYYAGLASGLHAEETRPSPLASTTLVRRDPVGVVQAYKLAKKYVDCQLVLAGGGATDDPEGAVATIGYKLVATQVRQRITMAVALSA